MLSCFEKSHDDCPSRNAIWERRIQTIVMIQSGNTNSSLLFLRGRTGKNPYLWGAVLAGAADAFCWGLYWETLRILAVNPLGTDALRCHLGLIAYSLLALFFLLIAAALLQKARTDGQWPKKERDLFYTLALAGIVAVMSGFEYLFWLDWQYLNPIPYILTKAGFTGLLVVFIMRIIRVPWRSSLPAATNPNDGC